MVTLSLAFGGIYGSTPERIRTSNLRFRRPLLYPVELRVRLPKSSLTAGARAGKTLGRAESPGGSAHDVRGVSTLEETPGRRSRSMRSSRSATRRAQRAQPIGEKWLSATSRL